MTLQLGQVRRCGHVYTADTTYYVSHGGPGGICKPCDLARERAYCRAHPDRKRNRWRQLYTGWTGAEYDRAYAAQAGACAICGGLRKILDADHDHETGHKRGLLCRACNNAIGLMRDDPARLRAAADYLILAKMAV